MSVCRCVHTGARTKTEAKCFGPEENVVLSDVCWGREGVGGVDVPGRVCMCGCPGGEGVSQRAKVCMAEYGCA